MGEIVFVATWGAYFTVALRIMIYTEIELLFCMFKALSYDSEADGGGDLVGSWSPSFIYFYLNDYKDYFLITPTHHLSNLFLVLYCFYTQ